jgi:hypothetical protein
MERLSNAKEIFSKSAMAAEVAECEAELAKLK